MSQAQEELDLGSDQGSMFGPITESEEQAEAEEEEEAEAAEAGVEEVNDSIVDGSHQAQECFDIEDLRLALHVMQTMASALAPVDSSRVLLFLTDMKNLT